MKTLSLTDDQLELLKVILEKDIEKQGKQLDEINEFGSDIRFEMWYFDTKVIHGKVLELLKEGA